MLLYSLPTNHLQGQSMEVISIALSCIGFLVGYILATRSTEKQIIKYINGISITINPKVEPREADMLKSNHEVFVNYLTKQIQHKEHRKV
ncbi:MAG: hypothetical protein ACRDCE_12515 [Cetobacterium sp.]|uniref:hypothetical protein n=1 Tax=Cetobacterium sp. TaxID=2071632 RepID=UPI003EE70BFA